MPVRLVAPDLAVNTDNVESVHTISNTDEFKDEHVIINFKELTTELHPQYTFEEIVAAMDGKCYYRKKWTDEVGEIDVCVLHGNNSRHNPHDPYRLCLTIDPYVEYVGPWDYPNKHEPKIEHSWEYLDKERQAAVESFMEKLDKEPTLVHVGNNDPKPSTPPDMIPYEDRPGYKRSLWDRLCGR